MKLIKFIPWPSKKELVGPKPVKAFIPQWWKDGESEFETPDGTMMNGMKTCVPFMEVMMTGYYLLTPFDIYVTKDENGNININWQGPDNVYKNFVTERQKELGITIPRPAGHYPNHFAWYSHWSWKTPRGYSTFVTQPFNRYDLPFTTVSGIIDSDKFHGNGNIPFFLKEGFEGIIPEGTPYAQVYPFKRNNWRSWIDDSVTYSIEEKELSGIRTKEGSYKKKFWQKKGFE
jgi:hypothetical protein